MFSQICVVFQREEFHIWEDEESYPVEAGLRWRILYFFVILLFGMWNIDDQHRNPNMNNKDWGWSQVNFDFQISFLTWTKQKYGKIRRAILLRLVLGGCWQCTVDATPLDAGGDSRMNLLMHLLLGKNLNCWCISFCQKCETFLNLKFHSETFLARFCRCI